MSRSFQVARSVASTVTIVIALLAASATGFLLLEPLDAAFGVLLAATALYVAAADVERFEIPDIGSVAIFALGLAWIIARWGLDVDPIMHAMLRSVVAGGFLYVVRAGYELLRKFEGLGLGDVKLAAAGAVWLLWSDLLIALLIAACAAILITVGRGLLARDRLHLRVALPFGAFLAPAIWIAWFASVYIIACPPPLIISPSANHGSRGTLTILIV